MKYIAAGYNKDAEKLLYDFVKENSTNFSVFATKWKEHNFTAIFLGRDLPDSVQFTNEIFQLTLEYLRSPSFIYQVGAVYLLYALYRNQFLNPPVRIRITLPQLVILRRIKLASENNCYINLHYVINYLLKNSFDFTALGTLCGPKTARGNAEFENEFPSVPILKELKSDVVSLLNSNTLEDIQTMGREYSSLKEKIFLSKESNKDTVAYEKYINCLEDLVNDNKYSRKTGKNKVANKDGNIGSRRAAIKAASFSRKAMFQKLNITESEDEDSDVKVSKEMPKFSKPCRRKRVQKSKRKVGRPRKYDLEKLLETEESEKDDKIYPNGCFKIKRLRGPPKQSTYLEKYDRIPTAVPHIPVKITVSSSSEESAEETQELELVF